MKELIEKGFRAYGYDQLRKAKLFQKRVQEKHHINVYEHDPIKHNVGATMSASFSVETRFECVDGTWAIVEYYGLNHVELLEKLDGLMVSMINAIPVLGGDPDTYEGKKY